MRDLEVIQTFVVASSRTDTVGALNAMFRMAISHFGFSNFCCISLADFNQQPSNVLDITEIPEAWKNRYLEKKYYQSDAILTNARSRLTPSSWSTYTGLTKRQTTIFNEAAEFGLVNGMSVPIFVPGIHPTLFSISGEHRDVDDDSFPILYMLALYYHEAILRIKRIKNNLLYAHVELTPRETECLQWVAVGKSDSVIGDILNISRNTVHFHIENVKRKFDVSTRVQTVVRAISAGKIIP